MSDYDILSIIPPLVAISLALITKNVIISLFLSVFIGFSILAGGNIFVGFTNILEKGIFEQMIGKSNAQVMALMIIIGGFIALIEKSGIARTFANTITKKINTKSKAQVATWLGGLIIFFTDSGNSLILGPLFQPIYDRLKISKQKLAYILDSTSSPVCILIPFIGWGIYIMSLIQQEFSKLGIAEHEFTAFIKTLPYQFYPICTLLLVPLIAITGKDFGPMAKAELLVESSTDISYVKTKLDNNKENAGPSMASFIVPFVVLFVVMFSMFTYFGFPVKPVPGIKLRISMGTAYLLATFTSFYFIYKEKIMSFKEAFNTYIEGMQKMVYVLIILVLAWSLGSVCSQLQTSVFLTSIAKNFITAGMLPFFVFVIGCIVSFSTGTSWGTFAIMMPIAIPMAYSLGAPIYATIGAVLGGGLFGDHCSPVSDTTILSSMASKCDLVDHVITQLPYALTAALGAMIAYVVAGFVQSPITLIIAIASSVILLFVFKNVWKVRD
ncbi:Na+/H+ antiporter NhaC family protein [Thermovenabulum sp.]|uniref:Na+/H+ antiporter NhaC family protein n=1 Tax=Thermovenabulum sp. TaxID=3100335 RepID=UPI003C7B6053